MPDKPVAAQAAQTDKINRVRCSSKSGWPTSTFLVIANRRRVISCFYTSLSVTGSAHLMHVSQALKYLADALLLEGAHTGRQRCIPYV